MTKEPTTFRMTTHAFGLSPSCANFAMRQLAQDFCTSSNKCASDFMQTGFYADNWLISMSSDEEVIDLIDKTVSLCSNGGLDLHKFSSNSKFVMQYVSERYDSELLTDLPGPTIERLLYVVWCVESDTLQFRIIVDSKPFTRRGILSTVSSIYDPLGFVGPFVLEGKIILQYMCQSSCGWDSPISDKILPWWQQWLAYIPKLESIKLKRCFKSTLSIKRAELHHFSDAADKSYGQCSYLRVIDTNDNIMCSLVMAVKVVSIPRLELAAAVLSCKVSKLLNAELCIDDLHNIYICHWCDSQIVLAYISNDVKRFHVYVANRVQTIRSYSSVDSWRYVPTKVNPADDSSRGINIDKLVDINHCRWFKGPAFLYQKDIPDFLLCHASLEKSDPALRAVCLMSTAEYATDLLDRLSYFSSWFKAKRAVENSILIMTGLM